MKKKIELAKEWVNLKMFLSFVPQMCKMVTISKPLESPTHMVGYIIFSFIYLFASEYITSLISLFNIHLIHTFIASIRKITISTQRGLGDKSKVTFHL